MAYHWNWAILFQEPYWRWLLEGVVTTILLSIAAWIIALCVGTGIGVARTSRQTHLRLFGTVYVSLFRNIPLLMQLFLWFFVLPELLPEGAGRWLKRDLPHPELFTAIIGLGLYTASRVAEQVRSGIEATGEGQRMAALSMGLTPLQTYVYLLIPVAYRRILLPLTSEFLSCVKNSSVALTIGVLELTARVREIESTTFQGFEAFAAATVLYGSLTTVVLLLMRYLGRRTAIMGMIGREAKA